MAIKIVALVAVWLLGEWALYSRRWSDLIKQFKNLVLTGIITAWLTAFHVAIALIHRREVYTFAERGGTMLRGAGEFFYIPAFLLNLIAEKIAHRPIFDIPLREIVDSHYWGVSIFFISLFSLYRFKGNKKGNIEILWILTIISTLAFFLISALINPSEWIGLPRKVMFIPSFCAALLCGFGSFRLLSLLRLRRGNKKIWLWMISGLVLAEMVGLKIAFYRMGQHHISLEDIPQVKFWKEISASQEWSPEDRFYTFRADLTFMLFPAFTGRSIANRIHQRDYTAEFSHFQKSLNKAFLDPNEGYPWPSECLALFNIRYLDLPEDGYSGRFRPFFPKILAHFRKDPSLIEMERRYPNSKDRQWFRYSSGKKEIHENVNSDNAFPVQVAFRNSRARFAFLPEKVIAIVGDLRRGETIFESIAFSPDFRFDKILYLLCENADQLGELIDEVDGVLAVDPQAEVPGHIRSLPFGETAFFYLEEEREDLFEIPSPEVEVFERYQVCLAVSPSEKGRFLFVSLQRFKDWHAYDQARRSLKVFKTGAGFSAVYIPARTSKVTLNYERPAYKTNWRLFSLLGWIVCFAGLAIPRVRRWVL